MRPLRLHVPALLTGVVLMTALTAAPAAAAGGDRASRWAPADRATIRPGVQMVTDGAQCTANFVFTDRRRRVYVGYAAHCAAAGGATETDGCRAGSLPLGTQVWFVEGAGPGSDGRRVGSGRLAYSSWLSMQRLRTRDADACAANDFALVRVGRRHVDAVNPTVPVFGGPTGLGGLPDAGAEVFSWGRSSLRPGTTLSPKRGVALGPDQGGWGTQVYTLTPGLPGDSGSGFLDAGGRAFGTLSTLSVAPLPAANGVGSLARELAWARAHSGLPRLRLVRGTGPFSGGAGLP